MCILYASSYDFLHVYDGNRTLDVLTGDNATLPFNLTSKSHTVFLKLVSDNSKAMSGFTFHYDAGKLNKILVIVRAVYI